MYVWFVLYVGFSVVFWFLSALSLVSFSWYAINMFFPCKSVPKAWELWRMGRPKNGSKAGWEACEIYEYTYTTQKVNHCN